MLNIVHHLKTIHSINADNWLFKAKLLCLIMASSKPTITVEPTMIERSTTSIMVIRNSDQGDSSNSEGGGRRGRRRRDKEEGRRRIQ